MTVIPLKSLPHNNKSSANKKIHECRHFCHTSGSTRSCSWVSGTSLLLFEECQTCSHLQKCGDLHGVRAILIRVRPSLLSLDWAFPCIQMIGDHSRDLSDYVLMGTEHLWNHSPLLRCSSQRRTEPCSGTWSTTDRLTCDTFSPVRQLKVNARPPMTAGTPGLSPAWPWLETSTAASMCAPPRRAALSPPPPLAALIKGTKKKKTSPVRAVIKLQTLSALRRAGATFCTPVLKRQHKKVRS